MSRDGRRSVAAATTTLLNAEITESELESELESKDALFRDAHRRHPREESESTRRRFVSTLLSSTAGLVVASSAFGSATPNAWADSNANANGNANASVNPDAYPPPQSQMQSQRIVRLSSGMQFSDERVGSGPVIKSTATNEEDPSSTATINDSNNFEGLEPDDPSVVLMHLKALRRDGSVLLDTFAEGKPMLFRLGSIPSEMYYLNEAGAIAKGKIPLGVQDAILAQGTASWEGGFGKADPMRSGGIRKVVVPSELAYGSKGVSRYEAYKMGLKQPVARGEVLRYEIELLRCNDQVIDLGGGGGEKSGSSGDGSELELEYRKEDGSKSSATAARACCLEEFYPCKMNGGSV